MDMPATIGFLCTGRSAGFDPLCNGAHSAFVLLVTLGAIVIAIGLGIRSTPDRWWPTRLLVSLCMTLTGGLAGFWIAIGLGNLLLG